MKRARFGELALASLMILGAAASAVAQPRAARPVTVEWITPGGEGCPDVAYLEKEIARLLAGPDMPEDRRMRARAEASHEGAWRVRVTTQTGGDRVLEAESCTALADATALILALAVDPARVAANRGAATATASATATATATAAATATGTATATGSATAAAPPTASPTPIGVPISSTTTSTRFTSEFALGARGAIDLGSLPNPAPGVGGSFAWLPGSPRLPGGLFRLELGVMFWPKQLAEVGTNPSTGGKFRLLTFDARACLPILREPFELAPCVGGELAILDGAGVGVSSPIDGSATWGALLGGGMMAYRLTRAWALRLGVDAVLPLARPTFVIQGLGFVHQPALVAGRAAVGIELRF